MATLQAPERITGNFHLTKYFNKIQFDFTFFNFIVSNTALNGICNQKYGFYKFQTFLWFEI